MLQHCCSYLGSHLGQNRSPVQRRVSEIMLEGIIEMNEGMLTGHKGIQMYHQNVGGSGEALLDCERVWGEEAEDKSVPCWSPCWTAGVCFLFFFSCCVSSPWRLMRCFLFCFSSLLTLSVIVWKIRRAVQWSSLFLLNYVHLINPPYRSAFLRYNDTLLDIFLASIYCKNYQLSLVHYTPSFLNHMISCHTLLPPHPKAWWIQTTQGKQDSQVNNVPFIHLFICSIGNRQS